MVSMADEVALVTGGAGGLGSAIARRLAAEGGIVVVADLATWSSALPPTNRNT